MNLKQIDAAITAYQDTLDETGRTRLAFFRTLWEEQDRIAKASLSQGYQTPDEAVLRDAISKGVAVFALAPAPVSEEELASAIGSIADSMAEHGGFTEELSSALRTGPWERAARDASATRAGSDPAAFAEAFADALAVEGADEQAVHVGVIAAMLAVRALIDGPARKASEGLRRIGAGDAHTLSCPVCGGDPALARIGDTDGVQGRGKELWCAQCGTTWPFDRVRCARCGTRNQGRLHYTSIEGDAAHRLALCDECGGYIRTVYQEDSLAPFSYEVEDVVTAPLDAVAADLAVQDEA